MLQLLLLSMHLLLFNLAVALVAATCFPISVVPHVIPVAAVESKVVITVVATIVIAAHAFAIVALLMLQLPLPLTLKFLFLFLLLLLFYCC